MSEDQTPIEWAMEIAAELTADKDTGALLRDAGTSVIQHLLAEVIAQRAIIEGRATPPTRAEVEAHHAAGGRWLYDYRGKLLCLCEDLVTTRIEAEGCRIGADHAALLVGARRQRRALRLADGDAVNGRAKPAGPKASSGKKVGCPVCGKTVTVQVDGYLWPHHRHTYRYAGTVPCEGTTLHNDDPGVDDLGRLIWKAAKAEEALTVLPAMIADARKKLASLESDLASAPAAAESAKAALNAWRDAHPKVTP